jgi:hypothetical protein
MANEQDQTTRERWRVISPSGRPCDFHSSSREEAEDHAISEALTGSRPTREACLSAAIDAGYRIERVGFNH